MKSCENCRYRKVDEDCLPCSACIDLGSDLSGWVGLTNADSIRGMTDEELAELFDEGCNARGKCPNEAWDGSTEPITSCRECWLDWLKSPVEVDE